MNKGSARSLLGIPCWNEYHHSLCTSPIHGDKDVLVFMDLQAGRVHRTGVMQRSVPV